MARVIGYAMLWLAMLAMMLFATMGDSDARRYRTHRTRASVDRVDIDRKVCRHEYPCAERLLAKPALKYPCMSGEVVGELRIAPPVIVFRTQGWCTTLLSGGR